MTPHVLVGLNCSAAPSMQSVASFLAAQKKARALGLLCSIRMAQQSLSDYLMAQNLALEVIESNEYSHLIFAADDIKVPEDGIYRLVNQDKDIISAIYRRRGDTKELCSILPPGEDLMTHVKNRDVCPAVVAPGHVMTIKKEVLEKVAKDFPELVYRDEREKEVPGIFMPFVKDKVLFMSDHAFSVRAISCGFKCWIDFGVRLKHRWETWLEVPE